MPNENDNGRGGDQDLSLLARVAAGDRNAFSAVVTCHGGAVMRAARALSTSEAQAEDLYQETFLAAFRRAGSFRGEGSARGWLVSITRRASYKAHRRRAGEPEHFEVLNAQGDSESSLLELGLAAGWGATSTPEQSAQRAQTRDALKTALKSLSVEAREVIALRDLAGLSGPEAAEALGIGVGALKTRLHRARLSLMGALRRGGYDGS